MQLKANLILLSILSLIVLMAQSCKKDSADFETDKVLFGELKASGFTYYQNGSLLPGAPSLGHGSFKLRFNAIANAALDSTGELPVGTTFPTGSLIVKEVFSGNNINYFAVMKKDPSGESASKGWIWAEINTDGSAKYSASKNGDGCTGCHGQTPNRDMVRTFDFH